MDLRAYVITGSSSGIGYGVAHLLAQTEFNLISKLPWYVRVYFDLRCRFMKAQVPELAAKYYLDLAQRENVKGKYFEADSGHLLEAHSSEESYDLSLAKQLWDTSGKLVGETFQY